MPTFYLNPKTGNDSLDGSSWANAWKTIQGGATAARVGPGDLIRIAKSPDPVSVGSATWTDKNAVVTLSAATTLNIDLCEVAWTSDAGANIVCGVSTSYRNQGSNSASIQVKAAFGTGLAAHKALAGATDYSSYQKISFFIRPSAAIAASALRIDLCSDTGGVTPVNSFTITDALASGQNYLLTLDYGGALGGSIQSVALYILTDLGASDVTLYLDNIFAANSLHLQSVIGKNDGPWWGICSIDGVTVTLGCQRGTATTRRFLGTSESVTSYARESIPWWPNSNTLQDSGTKAGGNIFFEGGYNTTTSLVDGETWLISMPLGVQNVVIFNSKIYNRFENIGITQADSFFSGSTSGPINIKNVNCTGTSYGLFGAGSVTANHLIWEGTNRSMFSLQSVGCGVMVLDTACNSWEGTANFEFFADMGSVCPVVIMGRGHRFMGKFTIRGVTSASLLSVGGIDNIILEADIAGDSLAISFLQDACFCEVTKLTTNVSGNTMNTVLNRFCRIGNLVISGGAWGLTTNVLYDDQNSGPAIDRYNANDRYRMIQRCGEISDHITGGQVAGWAYGGTGLSLLFNPTSIDYSLRHTVFLPVASGSSQKLHMQVRKTASGADCTLRVSIFGAGITPIIQENVTLTDAWAEYSSSAFTPVFNGFIRVELESFDGTTSGDIGIDDIHVAAA